MSKCECSYCQQDKCLFSGLPSPAEGLRILLTQVIAQNTLLREVAEAAEDVWHQTTPSENPVRVYTGQSEMGRLGAALQKLGDTSNDSIWTLKPNQEASGDD